MNHAPEILTMLVAALWSACASAGVYRCEQNGRTLFSDKPCVAGQEPLPVAQLNTMETSAGDAALAREYDRDIAVRKKTRDAIKQVRADKDEPPPTKKASKKSEPKAHAAKARGRTRESEAPQSLIPRRRGKPGK